MLTEEYFLNLGMEISEPGEYKAVDEQFLAYNTVCSAREKLYVTCADKLSDGTAASPSSIITEIQRIVPNCIKTDTSLARKLRNRKCSFCFWALPRRF